jgi:hypothetical protein
MQTECNDIKSPCQLLLVVSVIKDTNLVVMGLPSGNDNYSTDQEIVCCYGNQIFNSDHKSLSLEQNIILCNKERK